MKKHIAYAAFSILAAGTPALAQANGVGTSACLHRSQISDIRPIEDNRSLLVTDNARKLYKVTFQSKCFALNTRTAIRFVAFDDTPLACLERGDGIVRAGDIGMAPRCTINNIDYYHPVTESQPAGMKSTG